MLKLKRQIRRESDVQSEALTILRLNPRVAWVERTNTGAMQMTDRLGKSRYIRFGTKGWPDITGQLTDGRFLAVECKAPGKKPSPDQLAFLDTINKHGGLGICIDDSEKLLGLI